MYAFIHMCAFINMYIHMCRNTHMYTQCNQKAFLTVHKSLDQISSAVESKGLEAHVFSYTASSSQALI